MEDPQAFLAEADKYAAHAFLENPLCLRLRLLHAVIAAGGIWPENRFTLFERAIAALAHEHNPERQHDPRHAAPAIVKAAGRAVMLMLLSNARGIWRANGCRRVGTMQNGCYRKTSTRIARSSMTPWTRLCFAARVGSFSRCTGPSPSTSPGAPGHSDVRCWRGTPVSAAAGEGLDRRRRRPCPLRVARTLCLDRRAPGPARQR
ncbi:hypothetical protein AWV80_37030 [Cupriavidus sp. UYMU48A]|nr:hypothetical protein AWV80_37030 [Cupriavidus sp. UYMU48A]